MQPYFLPYLGYFQLINAVDEFVIYDNIEYTKKGWFNRNRYLCNETDKYFTVPLEKDSDYLDVRERRVSSNFDKEKVKNQIKAAYKNAPYFEKVFPLFCECIDFEEQNLFLYIFNSIKIIMEYLNIQTKVVISSTIEIDHSLKAQNKVLAICEARGATEYINPIGGLNLYDKKKFLNRGITLSFIEMTPQLEYKQFNNKFISSLSIIDVMMFNSQEQISEMLGQYRLL